MSDDDYIDEFEDDYIDEYEKEEERLWQYAETYFQSGDVDDLLAYRWEGGDMTKLLERAIERGELKFVQDAVKHGADVNDCYTSYDGVPVSPSIVTAVIQVTSHNELRPENARDIYGQDLSRETPAQISERRKIVEYLIKQGAKLSETEGFHSPLCMATGYNGFKDIETAEMLVKAGAPITDVEVERALRDSKFYEMFVNHGYEPKADDLKKLVGMNYYKQDFNDTLKIADLIIAKNPNALKQADTPEDPIILRAKHPKVALWLKMHNADMTRMKENLELIRNTEHLRHTVDPLHDKVDMLRIKLGGKVGKTADVKTGKVTDEHRETAKTQVEISKALIKDRREKEGKE